MKKLFKNESGRTMTEVLGVLAIIALLTVGSITGYSYLIKQQRRQETAKEVAQLVTSIRTSGMARRYAEGETIPAREAIKGPEMVDNGVIMKLPDGEESYAVVTTLNDGAFALALQMEKGTCPAVLNALAAQPGTMFEVKSSGEKLSASSLRQANEAFVQGTASGKITADPGATSPGGVRMNVVLDDMMGDDEKEREVAKERLASMCETCNKTGRASIIFDCPGGSSGYGHLYDVYCNRCARGYLQDAQGHCCKSYACGNLCSCPSGTMCDKDKNQCVTCATNGPKGQEGGNEQCWAVYKNEFARHVCDGGNNTCIECLTNMDCYSTIGPQNPYGRDSNGNYTHTSCVGHRCVECTVNYGETSGIPCPSGKPLCKSGACEPCPDGMIYDAASKKCVCETGVVHPATGKCVFCYDSAKNNETDVGCGVGEDSCRPMCSDIPGTNSFGVGGTNAIGTTCYECVIDRNCAFGEHCNQESHSCEGCPEGRFWDGSACRLCQDNRSGDVRDNGCNDGPGLCKPISGNGNGTGEYGDTCHFCRNNNYGNSQANKDEGCEGDAPLCEADDGAYGMECYKCRDDRRAAEQDSGCPASSPICLRGGTNGSFDAEKITNIYGTQCFVCVNDKDGYNTDTGCSKDKPMCNGAAGQTGTVCSSCPAGQIWNDILNNGCTVCYDSKTQAEADAGCGTGTWAGKPICVTPNKDNNGQGTSGSSCAVCINDKAEGVDTGCSDNLPMCNGAQGEFGTACSACPDGQIWNGKVCSVCFDTATGNQTDQGCGTGTWAGKPICVTPNKVNNGQGTAGNSCAICVNDKEDGVDTGCSSDKPNCDAEQGGFGSVCVVCADTKTGATADIGCGSGSEAGKPICGNGLGEKATNDGKGTLGKACVKCIDDKGYSANKTDSGCPDARPVCVNGERFSDLWRNEGSMIGGNNCVECVTNNYCTRKHGDKKPICNQNTYTCEACPSDKPFWDGEKCIACGGSDHCLDSLNRSGNGVNACIKVSDYVDIYRYSDGRCGCYKYLVSNKVSDEESCNVDFDRTDKRKTSRRERIYRVPSSPANFYCTYKFTARGEADDYVSGSYPAGISSGGKNNTHDTWKEAHDNRILNPTSTGTIGPKKGDQAYLIVSDRWLQEVGYSGDFVFTLANAHGAPNINNEKTGLSVSKGWNSGSSQCSPLGDWRKKD